MDLKGAIKIPLIGEELYKQDVYIKPFNVEQVKALSQFVKTNDPIGVIRVINETLSCDVGELFADDFQFVSYWQRINSYNKYPHMINWKCPHCGMENQTQLSVDILEYRDIKPDYVKGIKLKLDNYPDGVDVRMPKIKDKLIVNDFMRLNKWVGNTVKEEVLSSLMMLVDDPQFNNIDNLYLAYKGNKFTNDDFFTLDLFRDEYTWGVEPYFNTKCVSCCKEVSVEYNFTLTSFLPSNRDRINLKQSILAGETSESTDESV